MPSAPPERAALVTLAAELTRAHDTDTLIWALRLSLHAGGHDYLSGLIMKAEMHEAEGPACDPGVLAQVLIARLRMDGCGDVAEALASLLGEASIDCDPRSRLPEGDDWIAEKSELTARLRAMGYEAEADRYVSSELSHARYALTERLALDGHRTLAKAIDEVWWAFELPLRQAQGSREPPPAVVDERERPPEIAASLARGEALQRAYGAEVLACAVLAKLRAEGRESLAGAIMVYWLEEIIGPIVDPARLAAAVIPRLRAEGLGEIADAVVSLLHGVSIDRDPEELMALWTKEVAGPLIHAAGLAAALVARLRLEGREALADAVTALVGGERAK